MSFLLGLILYLLLVGFGMVIHWGYLEQKKEKRVEKIISKDLNLKKMDLYKKYFYKYRLGKNAQELIFLKEELSKRAFEDIELLVSKKFKIEVVKEDEDSIIYRVDGELIENRNDDYEVLTN